MSDEDQDNSSYDGSGSDDGASNSDDSSSNLGWTAQGDSSPVDQYNINPEDGTTWGPGEQAPDEVGTIDTSDATTAGLIAQAASGGNGDGSGSSSDDGSGGGSSSSDDTTTTQQNQEEEATTGDPNAPQPPAEWHDPQLYKGNTGNPNPPPDGWVVIGDGSTAMNPEGTLRINLSNGHYIEPGSGMEIDPVTQGLIDPVTGQVLDPNTMQPIDTTVAGAPQQTNTVGNNPAPGARGNGNNNNNGSNNGHPADPTAKKWADDDPNRPLTLRDLQQQKADAAKMLNHTNEYNYAKLAQDKAQFDAKLAYDREQMERIGIPELAIKQFEAQEKAREFERQMELSKQQFALDQQIKTGQLDLQRQNLGLDYLKTASTLQGPADWVKSWNFLRGAGANPNLPSWLQALQSGNRLPVYQAPATGAQGSAPVTMNSLADAMTGGQNGSVDMPAFLQQAAQLYAQGGGGLGPQSMEALGPTGQAMLQGAIGAVGGDWPGFLEQYQASRIGQHTAGAL